jgi:hypothetical protein
MLSGLKEWVEKKHIPVRLAIAVVAGIFISKFFTVLTHFVFHWIGYFPPIEEPMFNKKELLISLSFHSFFAIVGAYFTAMIAKDKAKRAVIILGTKELILWIIGLILLWTHNPPWFNITKALLGMPLALLGGWIYKTLNRKNRRLKTSASST